MKLDVLVIGLAALLGGQTVAGAQSLADIARKEAARRKTIAQPSRMYTDKDLRKTAPATAEPASPAGMSAPPPADAPRVPPTVLAAVGPKAAAEPEDPAKAEQSWRKRMADARAALERTEVLIAAMQSRINALWADFTARDDPAQRAQLGADRNRALSELDRLKKEREDQVKAIAGIAEEARQAGIPPGWLR